MKLSLSATRRAGAAVGLACVALACPVAPAAVAAKTPSAAKIAVSPAIGASGTVFTLSFHTPLKIGRTSSSAVTGAASVTAPRVLRACIRTASVSLAAAAQGALVHVRLAPHALGGVWCPGVYSGRVVETLRPVCAPGTACPAFVALREVGTFTLRVGGAHPGVSPS